MLRFKALSRFRCRIPDPFIGFNELDAEWVGEKSWTYRTTLPNPPADKEGLVTVLAFDGLDTFATVRLNGKLVLWSNNMFIPHRVDVTQFLQRGDENVLEIDFDSALLRAREIHRAHPEHKWYCFNGEPARLGVRKAQYHWGWDWGPFLMTAGPWKGVRMESFEVRIADTWIEYMVEPASKVVTGTFFAEVEGTAGGAVAFKISLQGDEAFNGSSVPNSKGLAKVDFKIKDSQLWYPHGYGLQPLYDFSVDLRSSDKCLDSKTKRIGLRQVELVQQPDHIGKTFYFRINGVEIFCGGSDWIPADSFVTRITAERYRQWIQTMVDGNQVMIRSTPSTVRVHWFNFAE